MDLISIKQVDFNDETVVFINGDNETETRIPIGLIFEATRRIQKQPKGGPHTGRKV